MNFYAALALIAFASYLILGVLVLLLDAKRPLNKVFFYYSLAAAIYSFTEFGYLQAESFETASFWLKARSLWPFTFACALHFHLELTGFLRGLNKNIILAGVYLPAMGFFCLDLFTDKITGLPILRHGIWSYQPPEDSLLPIISGMYALIYMLLMIGLITRYWISSRANGGKIRQQSGYVLGADLLVFAIVIINTFLQSSPDFDYINVDSALLLLSNVLIAFSIWRFSLLEITNTLVADEVISNMSEFLFLVNQEGIINVANFQARELSGFGKTEIEGKPIEHLILGALSPNHLQWSPYTQVHPRQMKGKLKTHDKNKLAVQYTIMPIPLKGSQELGYAYMGTAQLDENLSPALSYVIESGIPENTQEDQILKVINHDLSESARVTHLFAQLLNLEESVQGLVQLKPYIPVESHGLEIIDQLSKQQQYIQFIQNEARISRQKILALADYGAATKSTNFKKVQLSEAAHRAFANYTNGVKQTHINFSVSTLPEIEAIPEQIIRLFQELISNSARFVQPNVSPWIQVHMIKLDDQSCVIEFCDNGIGIPSEYSQKVFEIFQRLHPIGQYGGVGMGLSLCKKIMDFHHGSIEIKTNSQQGCNILISFPLRQNQ
ncbi:MAG: ATP-binding protein [Bacteroidia bacterium]